MGVNPHRPVCGGAALVLTGSPDPTNVGSFRHYRISHDRDWLTCVVGHLRVHIQYEIQAVSAGIARRTGNRPHRCQRTSGRSS